MAIRPIIFSDEMVRAILDGRKTQTRRPIKPQPILHSPIGIAGQQIEPIDDNTNMWAVYINKRPAIWDIYRNAFKCPYGKVGDTLWVRETWADVNSENGPAILYRAGQHYHFCVDDAYPVEYERYPNCQFTMWCGDLLRGESGHNWRSSIHMPKWASRITLEIINIRVERLWEISEMDARMEGIEPSETVMMKDGSPCYTLPFRKLWTDIYGIDNPKSWDANPYVWVIEFICPADTPTP